MIFFWWILAIAPSLVALAWAAENHFAIQSLEEYVMSTLADFEDVLGKLDAETTRIADKVAELVAKIQAGGLTLDEETQVKTALDAELAKLKAIGADPQNPVPVDQPPVDGTA